MMYSMVEVLWRGHTHWSMALTGGLCFLILYEISAIGCSHLLRALIGAAAITSVELLTGVLLNLVLGLDVWDYSDMPYDLFGQICPLYSVFWFILSLVSQPICAFLRRLR